MGSLLVLGAGILNAVLGYYLLRIGRRRRSLILEADGKHVLTDSWTSFGVVAGLVLVLLTRWKPIDPLVAIAVALNILWSGGEIGVAFGGWPTRLRRSQRGKKDPGEAGCNLWRTRNPLSWRAVSHDWISEDR